MLWPTIVVLITTSTIGVLKAFDLVYIMIGNNARGRTIGLSMFIETFENNKPGYGSAVAVVMLIVVLPFIIFNIRRFRSEG
jgi:alpha-glucoside transport system permease protein